MGFREQLQHVINTHSMENGSDTPDHILAEYMGDCLSAFDKAVSHRERWYGRTKRPSPVDSYPGHCEEGPDTRTIDRGFEDPENNSRAALQHAANFGWPLTEPAKLHDKGEWVAADAPDLPQHPFQTDDSGPEGPST